jgi:hypothetical protein
MQCNKKAHAKSLGSACHTLRNEHSWPLHAAVISDGYASGRFTIPERFACD